MEPGAFIRLLTTRKAEMCSEITVAQPTPSTPMCSPTTKIRFRHTFTTPAAKRKYRGRLVSPTARRMALPKLYSMSTGIPAK